jgi:hypothetical protein
MVRYGTSLPAKEQKTLPPKATRNYKTNQSNRNLSTSNKPKAALYSTAKYTYQRDPALRPMQKRIEKLLVEKAAEMDHIEVKAEMMERNAYQEVGDSSSEGSQSKNRFEEDGKLSSLNLTGCDPNTSLTNGTLPVAVLTKHFESQVPVNLGASSGLFEKYQRRRETHGNILS